jgi:hypothetical protein
MPRYGTAAEARKRAHNMGTQFYTDDEINELLDNYSLHLHLLLGRAATGADYTSGDVEFGTVKIYTINSAACEMLGSVEIDDDGKCEKAAKDALDALMSGGNQFPIVTGGWGLVDGVDEDLYSQRDL